MTSIRSEFMVIHRPLRHGRNYVVREKRYAGLNFLLSVHDLWCFSTQQEGYDAVVAFSRGSGNRASCSRLNDRVAG